LALPVSLLLGGHSLVSGGPALPPPSPSPVVRAAMEELALSGRSHIIGGRETRSSEGDLTGVQLFEQSRRLTPDVCFRVGYYALYGRYAEPGRPFHRFEEIKLSGDCGLVVDDSFTSLPRGVDAPAAATALQTLYDATVAVQQREPLRGISVVCVKVAWGKKCPARSNDLLAVLPLQELFKIEQTATGWSFWTRSNYGTIWQIELLPSHAGEWIVRLTEERPPPF
jgi:hypothetical protein